jgi:hypothetical protein
MPLTDAQIKHMVDRFLGWRLPKPWNPDNGVSYQRPNYAHAPAEHDWPTGTNLFDADQATAMVRHMVEGMPKAKRRKVDALVKGITDRLADDGKIIEGGWLALRATAIPEGAPQVKIDEMRNAFFAGAQHLFASIVWMLDPESEPTQRDYRRMDNIDKELRAFIASYSATHVPTRGSP